MMAGTTIPRSIRFCHCIFVRLRDVHLIPRSAKLVTPLDVRSGFDERNVRIKLMGDLKEKGRNGGMAPRCSVALEMSSHLYAVT
jgi:hypothetical protein